MSELDYESRSDTGEPADAVTGRVRGTDGAPISDATITLIDTGGQESGRAATDDTGTFRLPFPSPDRFLLLITAAGHESALDLVNPDRAPEQEIALQRHTSVISGVVRERRFGRPVAGASLALVDARGITVQTVTTGPDGCYSFSDLPAGAYSIVVSSPPPAARTARLTPGTHAELDLNLAGTSRLNCVSGWRRR